MWYPPLVPPKNATSEIKGICTRETAQEKLQYGPPARAKLLRYEITAGDGKHEMWTGSWLTGHDNFEA